MACTPSSHRGSHNWPVTAHPLFVTHFVIIASGLSPGSPVELPIWPVTCYQRSMERNSVATQTLPDLAFGSGERRKNPRFDMHFPVFLRRLGDPWTICETANVSAPGAFFVADRPFLLNTPVEYVLTFPPNLTKAPQPLRVRYFGIVLRCERVPNAIGAFGIAVRNTAHRYLTRDESVSFDTMEQQLASTSGQAAENQANDIGS